MNVKMVFNSQKRTEKENEAQHSREKRREKRKRRRKTSTLTKKRLKGGKKHCIEPRKMGDRSLDVAHLAIEEEEE